MTLREFADRIETQAFPVSVIAAEARAIADSVEMEIAGLRAELESALAKMREPDLQEPLSTGRKRS